MQLYYPEGMKLHGENALKYCGFTPYEDRIKPSVFWLYFAEDYEIFKSHEGDKYVFWHNSDVNILRSNFLYEVPELLKAKHACHNTSLQEELAYIGIFAEVKPYFFNDIVKYKPSVKSEKITVYCTTNPGREFEYGVGYMVALSHKFKHIDFHVFGTDGDNTDNLYFHGWIAEDEMDILTQDMHICLRMNKHDGIPQTCIKAALRNQLVLSYLDHGYFLQVKDFKSICDSINFYSVNRSIIYYSELILNLNKNWYEDSCKHDCEK